MDPILIVLILFALIVVGVVCGIRMIVKRIRRKITAKKARKDYPHITRKEFSTLAKQAARKIKRVSSITVEGARIVGRVTSQSRISEWQFVLDFGDIDHLSGNYSKYSENTDSEIPSVIGDAIKEAIQDYPHVSIDRACYYAFCPLCGKRLSEKKGEYCPFCGEKFSTEDE